MKSISERHLSIVIPLLFYKIEEMKHELNVLETEVGANEFDDEQMNECYELQECIEQYSLALDSLRQEYEKGLAEGISLPSYEQLTGRGSVG